jgi:hypothetical protein
MPGFLSMRARGKQPMREVHLARDVPAKRLRYLDNFGVRQYVAADKVPVECDLRNQIGMQAQARQEQ